MQIINSFSQIELESPVDKIIRQIRDSISNGLLKPGDRLPSERKLSEKLGVGRTHLRDALRKLEFYGIVKTLPQNGTIVAGLGLQALEGLITDMLDLQTKDFKSLVESRVVLETSLAQLAAVNRTDSDIMEIKNAFEVHRDKILNGEDAVEEDFMFHLKIADASKNSVLKSLMLIITPDIMQYFKKHNVCGDGRSFNAVKQHEDLLQYIIDKDSQRAGEALNSHLHQISVYANGLESNVVLNKGGVLNKVT
jgi:GntR family transcriptional repressor for pyruvate dehydrogenase complex